MRCAAVLRCRAAPHGKAQIQPQQFPRVSSYHPRSILVASSRACRQHVASTTRTTCCILARHARFLTFHEEIGRVGRGCYEDASDLSATSRACRANLHRSRPPADQSGKRVASWTGKSPDTRDIRVASSRGCRACRAWRRGCYEDATGKLLPWNISLTQHDAPHCVWKKESSAALPGV